MIDQHLIIALNLLAGASALVLMARALKRRDEDVMLAFAVLMLMVAGWAITYAVLQAVPTLEAKATIHKLKQPFALTMPLAWFIFAVHYTRSYRLRSMTLGILLILPTISVILALSNEQHHLLYSNVRLVPVLGGWLELIEDVSFMGILTLVYSAFLILYGLYLLIQSAMRVIGTYRAQVRMVLIMGLMIFIAAMMEYSSLSPFQHINMLQVFMAGIGVLIWRYLLTGHRIGGTSISYDRVITTLPDAMVVLDPHLRVVSVNPAFANMFKVSELELLGKPLATTVPIMADLLEQVTLDHTISDDFRAFDREIQVNCAPIDSPNTGFQGYVILCHDITQERDTQQSLIDAERRYRALFDQSNDAIFIFDSNGVILLANQLACDLLGTTANAIKNREISSFLADNEVMDLLQRVQHLLDGYNMPIAEQTLIALDGSKIPVEVSITLVTDGDGKPLNLQMVARDIRERKRAQNVVANERHLLRTLFDSMPDYILMVDTKQRYTLVNQRLLDLFGLASADDFLGKTANDFYPPEKANELFEKTEEVIESGFTMGEEEKRDDYTWVLVTRIPIFDAEENVAGVLIVERDITESRLMNIELQRSLEQLMILRQVDEEVTHTLHMESVGIIALDAALRLSRASAGFIALDDEADQLQVQYVIGGYNRFKAGEALPLDSITGRVVRNLTGELVTNLKLDDDYIPDVLDAASVMSIPIMVQDNLLGVMELVTRRNDVFTEDIFQFISLLANRIAIALDNAKLYELTRHQLAEVQSLNVNLRELEQIKTDMIRIASHDLKNPLGVIDGYLNMLEMDRELFEPVYLEYFASMQRAVVRMNKILSDILSLERVQQYTGGYSSLVDLQFLASRVLEEFVSQAETNSQELAHEVDVDTATIIGDEAQMYEAMTNLVSNAIKYTPEGGKISVRLYEEDEDWVFEVEDNGVGIPQDRQDRLFEPFYRAKAAGTEKIDGTGLGLHLVKKIVERHGGEMFYSSRYQQGSLFGFRVPQPRPERIDDLHASVDNKPIESEFASEGMSAADASHDVSQNETSSPSFFDDL